jgi:pimeloyl-ACP methyl ester carboxylesterase
LQDDHKVIAIDMLEWGGTLGWPGPYEDLLEDEAALVHEITKGLCDEIHLVGHSYGGTVSYHLAMSAPDKIKSLTLIEPMLGWILDPEVDTQNYDEILGVAQNFWDQYSIGKPEEGIKNYFDYWNGEGSWKALDKGLSDYILAGAKKNFYEFKAIFEGGKGLAAPESFMKPTLLVGGAQSNRPPLRVLEILENRLPYVSKHLIEGAAHMSPITHGDQVNQIIKAFVAA